MGLLHKIGDSLLVGFKGLDGGSLVVLHQSTVTDHVGAENAGALTVIVFRFHADTPLCRRFGKSKLKEMSPK
jgi:hypothetical protein